LFLIYFNFTTDFDLLIYINATAFKVLYCADKLPNLVDVYGNAPAMTQEPGNLTLANCVPTDRN
jgi:hypothetical protein